MFAPNKPQLHVIDHTSGNEMKEQRNVLVESARISRGKYIHTLSLSLFARLRFFVFGDGLTAATTLVLDAMGKQRQRQAHDRLCRWGV